MSITYTFTGNLVLHGSLHIGSGGGDDRTDATVVRDSRGYPYIPGSSLRGAFRAAIERLAPTLTRDTPARDMTTLEREMKQEGIEGKSEKAVQEILCGEGGLNTLERLFGTTYWASPLFIPDLPLITEGAVNGEIRHGVGIDRDTGAAKEQVKYDFEVLPRGTAFRFLMRCEMASRCETTDFTTAWENLLAIGLRLLEKGEILLGGNQARGIGQVRLEAITLYWLDMHNKEALKAMLLQNNNEEARYGTRYPDARQWIQQRIERL